MIEVRVAERYGGSHRSRRGVRVPRRNAGAHPRRRAVFGPRHLRNRPYLSLHHTRGAVRLGRERGSEV